jgi:PPOX class probable F420-dependent enzyme
VFPDPASDLGRRFRERLRTDLVAWLTLVADSGTPQPSPVGFLWVEETEDVVIYSQATARRLDWLDRRDRASLHLSDDGQGRDYLVMTGTLHRLGADYPAPDEHDAFLSKYRTLISSAFGSPAAYAARFSVPLIFTPQRVRGL